MADDPNKNYLQDMSQLMEAASANRTTQNIFNISRENNNNLTNSNQILMDRETLSPLDFRTKYGDGIYDRLNTLDQSRRAMGQTGDIKRTGLEATTDAISNVGGAFLETIVGLEALALRPFNRDLSQSIARGVDIFRDWRKSNQSDYMKRNQELHEIASHLDEQDNLKQYDEDLKSNSEITAGLKYFGRGFVNSLNRVTQSSSALETGIQEATGSLLVGGPVSRGLGAIGKAATKTGLVTNSGRLATLANNLRMPAAIGALEGGGAYTEVVNDVLKRSHKDLTEKSPEYRELIASGVEPDEARRQIADRAGLIAASIQAPVGALTGTLVGRFEEAPFIPRGIGPTARNIGAETIEESTQGFSGQLAQNIALRNADENQRLLEGTGQAVAEGGLFGGASSAVIQAPGTALRTTSQAISSGYNALRNRGTRIIDELDNDSSVSEQNVSEAIIAAKTDAPVVAEAIQEMAQQANITEQEPLDQFVGRVINAINISPEEIGTLPEHIRTNVEGETDRFTALAQMAQIAANPNNSQEDRTSAALFINNQLNSNKRLFTEDLPEFLDRIPQESEAYEMFSNYQNVIKAIEEVPSIKQALNWVRNEMEISDENVTPERIQSPEGQQIVDNVANASVLVPEKVSPKLAEMVLYQADLGNINLEPNTRKAIQSSISLNRVAENYADILGTGSKADIVNKQIETEGGLVPHQLSLAQHVAGINESVAAGNLERAREKATDLGLFARHMAHKLGALNRSYNLPENTQDRSVPYQTLGASHKWMPKDKWNSVFVNPKSEKSLALANRIYAESNAAITLANNIAEIYPEFGIKQISVPKPDFIQDNIKKTSQEITKEASKTVPEAVKQEETVQEPVVTESLQEASKSQTEAIDSSKPVDTTAATESLTLETKYPSLMRPVSKDGTKKDNMFVKAYRLPKESKSILLDMDKPLTDIKSVIEDADITQENEDGYKRLLSLGSTIRKTLNKRLAENINKKDGKGNSFGSMLRNGVEVNKYRRGLALNIVDMGDNSLRYNPQLIESAILAGLDWAANFNPGTDINTPEEIAAILEVPVEELDNNDIIQFNRGVSSDAAIRSLSDHIRKFWGLNINSNIAQKYTKGIVDSVAAEILYGLFDTNLVAEHTLSVMGTPKTVTRIVSDSRPDSVTSIIDSLNGAANLLRDTILKGSEKVFYINEAPKNIDNTQLRNPMVQLTSEQKRLLKNEQNNPHYLNSTVKDFMVALGKDNYVRIFGGTINDFTNNEHKKSLEGKIRTLSSSYDNVLKQVAELEAFSQKENKSSSEVPVYYEFGITKVNRLQPKNHNSPVTDKFAREIFMPTKTTLDMSDSIGSDAQKFWVAVAQGIGEKTEKLYRNDVVNRATKATTASDGKFYPLVQGLISWLDTNKLPNNFAVDLANIMGNGLSMHGIHSLISVAKYLRTKRDDPKSLKQFENYNYLEADGKTNGPINALVIMTPGPFTSDWLDQVAKGGLNILNPESTLNEHVQERDNKDLYEAVTDVFTQKQSEFINSIQDSPDVVNQNESLMRFMSALNVDINYNPNTNEIVIKRGIAKNPLTITVYGSGISGIAGKVTKELVNSFYETLTEYSNQRNNDPSITLGSMIVDKEGKPYGEKALREDLENLTTSIVFKNKKDNWIRTRVDTNTGRKASSIQEVVFSPDQFNNLRTNIQALFVNQLDEAIQQAVMGHVKPTTTLVQQASQAQSSVITALFHKAVAEKLADKTVNDPEYRQGDFLSDNDLKEIYDSLSKYAPLIDDGDQKYFISGSERNKLFPSFEYEGKRISVPENFGAALDDTLRSDSHIYGPSLPGVAYIPSLTIGSGDGRMMLRAGLDRRIKGTLKVFDGMNMPVNMIDDYSKIINEKVFDTWTHNPIKSFKKTWDQFIKSNPLETLKNENNPTNVGYENLREELSKIVQDKGKIEELSSWEDIEFFFNKLTEDFTKISNQIDARQATLKEVSMSVDQMASAESPYLHKGNITFNNTSSKEEIIDTLNKKYQDKLNNPVKEDLVSEVTTNSIKELNIEKVDIKGLRNIVKSIRPLSAPIQKEMLTHTLRLLEDNNWNFVFGSQQDIVEYEKVNHPDRYIDNSINYFGKTDFGTKTVYLTNKFSETLVHELIHAATLEKVMQYVEGSKSLSQADREALRRIEGLMHEWLADSSVASSEAIPISVVRSLLNQDKRIEAINEFMAWSLSNQQIYEQQKKMKVKDRLNRIMGEALKYIKNLIWRDKRSPVSGNTIASNLRFNTRVLLATPTEADHMISDLGKYALYQTKSFGNNNRVSVLRDWFSKRVANYVLKGDPVRQNIRKLDALNSMIEGQKVAESFMAHGFNMSMQEAGTFRMIQAALMTETNLNENSLSRITDLYNHVINEVKVEDFMNDPQSNDPADRYQAQEKFDVLNGVYYTSTDNKGRSSLMSSFLALSMVNDDFRNVINKIKLPKEIKAKNNTLDNVLDNIGISGLENLEIMVSGQGRNNNNIVSAMDALVDNLIQNSDDQRTYIENEAQNLVDKADNYIRDGISILSEQLIDKSRDIINSNAPRVIKGAARISRLAGTFLNESAAATTMEGLMSAMNSTDNAVTAREFAYEIIGRTEDSGSIYDMINPVRAEVQQTRQRYREGIPEIIKSKFNKELSDKEWSHMHKALGQTDLGYLANSYNINKAIEFVNNKQTRDAEIAKLEKELSNLSGSRYSNIIKKSKQLANYMLTGETGSNLLRNAYTVAHSFGERGSSVIPGRADNLVNIVDNLVSLYAIDGLNKDIKDTINNLVKDEPEGLAYTTSFTAALAQAEIAKVQSPMARMNYYKGTVPVENQIGVSLTVVPDSEHGNMIRKGYVKLAPYNGSSADITLKGMSYYFSPVNSRATYNQGILQTVHQTASGIDPRTGYSVNKVGAGIISDPRMVSRINQRLSNQRATNENLLPVYNDLGEIVAFERSIDPKYYTKLNQNDNLSEMLGVWKGRQVEENLANHFNEALIDNLDSMWQKAKKDKTTNQFVDISSSNDPIHKDSWNIIPTEIKTYIESVFGKDGFPIRRDLINNSIGYRSASVGDLWTGETRWNDSVAKEVMILATGVFGKDAYPYLMKAEKILQKAVTDAKVLIVVKSVIVPVANLVANMYQLTTRGVPLRHSLRGLATKTSDINNYIKRRNKEIELETDLIAAKGRNDTVAIRKLNTQIQSIKDSYKRSSLWPLIEAGEFSGVVDGGISNDDLALSNGTFTDYINNIVDKLPTKAQTAFKYGIIAKDTSLFKGLARSVQYGDFIGKAILYDYLTKNQNKTKEEALKIVAEEFVNYNYLAGRTRSTLEGSGLLWFWNFKLRSIKVAHSMIRNNPFRALMSMVFAPNIVGLGDVGSPLTDNAITKYWENSLGYTVGPQMGFNAWSLNPWVNITK